MDIVVLISGHHLGSVIGLNQLVRHISKRANINIKAVMESDVVFNSKKGVFKHLYSLMSVASIRFSLFMLFEFLLQKILFLHCKLFKKERKLFSVDEIVDKYTLAYYNINDLNSEENIKILKKINPDFIVSICFDQILKDDVLSIPKYGCVNLHPGLLPKYRGVKPSFWAIVNGEKRTGVTVHFMDKGIDTGKVLAKKSFRIRAKHTLICLMAKSVKIGTKLMVKQLEKIRAMKLRQIERFRKLKKLKKLSQFKKINYYSIPTSEAVSVFKSKGRKFISIKRYLNMF